MRWIGFLSLILAVSLFGCGGGGSSEADKAQGGSPTAKEALTDLVDLLKEFEAAKKKLPSKVADLEPFEPIHQGAYLGLIKGEIVYVWGIPISAGDAVIAYEKSAESAGGYVLLQDGTVKQMTAEEFKAAPKASKK